MYANDGEDGRVQRRVEIVGMRHDRAQVLPHQVRMVLHGFGKRAEDDADISELLLECRRDRHAVEDRVHRDAGQHLLFVDRNTEFLEGLANFGIDLVQALQARLLLGRRVVDDLLVVDRVDLQVVPRRLFHLQPGAIPLQPPLEEPLGLLLLGGDQPDDVLVQAGRNLFGFDVGDKPVLVFACCEFFNCFSAGRHICRFALVPGVFTRRALPGSDPSYALKESPQPQVLFAFGLLNRNPRLIRLVS